MKSRISYLTAITLLLFFSSCTPPGGEAGKSGGSGGTIQLVFPWIDDPCILDVLYPSTGEKSEESEIIY